MITGLGRTGKRWGVDHTGVRPDIVTIGKAFGGGFPLSGLLTTDAIAQAKPWGNPSGSSSSYGGNPLGAAAGAAALQIIDEEELVENARVVGAALQARAARRSSTATRSSASSTGAGLLPRAWSWSRTRRPRSRCRAR